MEQMIDFCVQFVDEFNKNTGQHLTADEYREQLRQYFPQLKRWRKEPTGTVEVPRLQRGTLAPTATRHSLILHANILARQGCGQGAERNADMA